MRKSKEESWGIGSYEDKTTGEVYVSSVSKCALFSGFQPWDQIITIDGKRIKSSSDFNAAVVVINQIIIQVDRPTALYVNVIKAVQSPNHTVTVNGEQVVSLSDLRVAVAAMSTSRMSDVIKIDRNDDSVVFDSKQKRASSKIFFIDIVQNAARK